MTFGGTGGSNTSMEKLWPTKSTSCSKPRPAAVRRSGQERRQGDLALGDRAETHRERHVAVPVRVGAVLTPPLHRGDRPPHAWDAGSGARRRPPPESPTTPRSRMAPPDVPGTC